MIPPKYLAFGLVCFMIISQMSAAPVSDDEEEVDVEEQEKRNQAGVLDIVSGALSGNFDKIINGAFAFTDDNIREGVVPVITGKKPAPRPTTAASAGEAEEEEGEEENANASA